MEDQAAIVDGRGSPEFAKDGFWEVGEGRARRSTLFSLASFIAGSVLLTGRVVPTRREPLQGLAFRRLTAVTAAADTHAVRRVVFRLGERLKNL